MMSKRDGELLQSYSGNRGVIMVIANVHNGSVSLHCLTVFSCGIFMAAGME
jgi:hypothetical protein